MNPTVINSLVLSVVSAVGYLVICDYARLRDKKERERRQEKSGAQSTPDRP